MDTDNIGPLLVVLPLISSFLFPTLASTLVDERREKLYLMMRIEGVRAVSCVADLYQPCWSRVVTCTCASQVLGRELCLFACHVLGAGHRLRRPVVHRASTLRCCTWRPRCITVTLSSASVVRMACAGQHRSCQERQPTALPGTVPVLDPRPGWPRVLCSRTVHACQAGVYPWLHLHHRHGHRDRRR